MKSSEGEISKSECERVDRAAPEGKPKETLICWCDESSGHGDKQGVGEWEGEVWSAIGHVTTAQG